MNTLSYVCRNRDHQTLFVKVGTEALPNRTEILAVIDGENVMLASAEVDSDIVTDVWVSAAKSAAAAGTSHVEETIKQKARRVEAYLALLPTRSGLMHTSLYVKTTTLLSQMLREELDAFKVSGADLLGSVWYEEIFEALEGFAYPLPNMLRDPRALYRERYGN